jgi:hemoglobin
MSEQTLFDSLGGPSGVAKIVREMYGRVLADPELAPFFENISMNRLRRMQYQFIASALDGPVDYSGTELSAIHMGKGITGHHFARFCGHFADAIEAHGASSMDVDQALGRLSIYKDRITGDTNIDG